MNAPVTQTLRTGVPNRRESFAKLRGSSPSRLIASGLRDAASSPPLPVVTNAIIAATDSSILPPSPITAFAAVLTGV